MFEQHSSSNYEVILLPRYSFTAHRLMFQTVIELSESFRTVILGGNCNVQYKKYRYNIRKNQKMKLFYSTRLSNNINYQTLLESIYERRKFTRRRIPRNNKMLLSHSKKFKNIEITSNMKQKNVLHSIRAIYPYSNSVSTTNVTYILKGNLNHLTSNEDSKIAYIPSEKSPAGNKALIDAEESQVGHQSNLSKHGSDFLERNNYYMLTSGFESQEFFSAFNYISDRVNKFNDSTDNIELISHSTTDQYSGFTNIEKFNNDRPLIHAKEGSFTAPAQYNETKYVKFTHSKKPYFKVNDIKLINYLSENFTVPSKSKVKKCSSFKHSGLTFDLNLRSPVEVYPEVKKPEVLTNLPPKSEILTKEEMIAMNLIPKYPHSKQYINNLTDIALNKMKVGISEIFDLDSSRTLTQSNEENTRNILLNDKVLMMIKLEDNYQYNIPTFTDVEPFDMRILDRWKEYNVILREKDGNNNCLDVEFYKTLKPIKNRGYLNVKAFKIDANINFSITSDSQIKFYNLLDKSICIEGEKRKIRNGKNNEYKNDDLISNNSMFYIFCFQSRTASIKWFSLLKNYFGFETFSNNFSLKLPDLSIGLKFKFNEDDIHEINLLEEAESEHIKLIKFDYGYKVLQSPVFRYINSLVFQEIKKIGSYEIPVNWLHKSSKMGLSLKYYDRLEWCSEYQFKLFNQVNLLKNIFTLEYRPYGQNPPYLELKNKIKQKEPQSIEGYVIKFKGLHDENNMRYGGLHTIPSYLFTTENIIFSLPARKSEFPLSRYEFLENANDTDTSKNYVLKNIKTDIYEQNPFPLDTMGNIKWVDSGMDIKCFTSNDKYAKYLFKRNISNILCSENLLDLVDIVDVYQGNADDNLHSKKSLKTLLTVSNWFWGKQCTINDICASIVNIEISSNTKLQFLTPNNIVAAEWVQRLRYASSYWKEKQHNDMIKSLNLKVTNMTKLKISEIEDSNIQVSTPKWIIDNGLPDPKMNNITSFALQKPILHKGMISQKSKKHTTFSKYFAVLTPGFLILYNCFSRSATGFSLQDVGRNHYMTIPLKNCYIYSGDVIDSDLIKMKHTLSGAEPGKSVLPRVYGDGWRSFENESLRSFAIWFGSDKLNREVEESENKIFNSNFSKEIYNENISHMRNKDVHNLKHIRSMIFLTRSRQDRDNWVMSIQYELERLNN